MTRFLLIRHGLTDSVGKRFSGRLPGVHLNDEGRLQAQTLVGRMADVPLTAIYSSPMERTLETAEPLANSLNLPVIPRDNFLEVDLGDWTNLTFEELRDNQEFQLFNSFRSHSRIPGGEMMMEAQTRMIAGLEKLRKQHIGETVAVFSHADLIKSAIAFYAGTHLDLFQRFEISPASVSIVEVFDETARIILANSTGKIGF